MNEITDRDLDTDGDTAYDDTHYDLLHNKRGDSIDDGQRYTSEYDVGRHLRFVRNRSNAALYGGFQYNGLIHRMTWLTLMCVANTSAMRSV